MYKMARTKFSCKKWKLLLLTFFSFITLSDAVVTEETQKCYWCGPLADQVHRSRRAPPCDAAESNVITCEPDLPYCAVVATSPPYVESRLCVKLYQDECYPLFCNSTKSWKMTCPCKGDLCNGPNTDREIDAFELLGKLVAKTRTTRIKKRTQINTVKFIPSGVEKTVIITNISALESNELNNSVDEVNNNEVTQIIMSEQPSGALQETKEESTVSSDATTKVYEMDEVSITVKDTLTTKVDESDETHTTIKDIFTTKVDKMDEIQTTIKDMIATKVDEIHTTLRETVTTKVDEMDEPSTIKKEMETKSVETAPTEKLITLSVSKPSEELPTAEALQQNASPKTVTEKTTAPTTTQPETTTYSTTDVDIDITTKKSLKQKNDSGKLRTSFSLVGLNFILAHISK